MQVTLGPKELNVIKLFAISALIIILNAGVAVAASDMVPDTENCLYCHRYPNMGRYDESGRKKIYYVNDKQFAQSVHGKVKCKNCHVGLDKIPHTDVKKVDCSTKCHIKEPSTNQEFSHKNMIEKYDASVHGRGTKENLKPFPEDLPTCTYCHDNRIYNPFAGLWGKSQELSKETLARCEGCHVKEAWAQNFYSHFTHRMRRRRTQAEVVKLCTSCHENREKMSRHGIETIETFKDTFHWVLIKYDVKDAPDCISCHVPVGYATHELKNRNDRTSPVNVLNRVNTCSHQGGVQTCHAAATPDFATGRVHAYGIKAQLAAAKGFTEMTAIQKDNQSLIDKRALTDMTEAEIFHFMIIKLVKLFYKILIPVIIGSMCLHQWMEYLSIRRKKKGSH
jgi:hypothetical protein